MGDISANTMGRIWKILCSVFLVFLVHLHLCSASWDSSVTNDGKVQTTTFHRNYIGIYFDPASFMRHNFLQQTLDECGRTALVNKIHSEFDQIMVPFHIPVESTQDHVNLLLLETVAKENVRIAGSPQIRQPATIKLIILCKVHNWKDITILQEQVQLLRDVIVGANSVFPGTVTSVLLELRNTTAESYQNYALFRQLFRKEGTNCMLGQQINIDTAAFVLVRSWKNNLQNYNEDIDIVYFASNGKVNTGSSSTSAVTFVETLIKHFVQYRDVFRSFTNSSEIGLIVTWPDTSVRGLVKYSSLLDFWGRMNNWAAESKTFVIFLQAFDTPFAPETKMMTNGWWRLLPNSSYLHPSQFIFEDKLSLTDFESYDKSSLLTKLEWLQQETYFNRGSTGVVFNPNVLRSRIGKPYLYGDINLDSFLRQISTKFSKILISTTRVPHEDRHAIDLIPQAVARFNLNESAYSSSQIMDVIMTFNESSVYLATLVAQEVNKTFPNVVKQLIYVPSNFHKDDLVDSMLTVKKAVGEDASFGFGLQLNVTVCMAHESLLTTMQLAKYTLNSIPSKGKLLYMSATIPHQHTTLGVDRLLPLYTAMLGNCKTEVERYFQSWREDIHVSFLTEWPLPDNPDLRELMEFVRFWEGMNEFSLSSNSTVIFSSALDDPNGATHGWWKLLENETYPESANDFIFEDKKQAAQRYAEEELSVEVPPSSSLNPLEISAIVFPVLLILVILSTVCYFEIRRKSNYLTMEEIVQFFNGGGNPHLEGISQPYHKARYELLIKCFTIKETTLLGSGAFGKVCLGTINRDGEEGREVAVKMTKIPCPRTALRALLFEIKILAYLGKHPHIVEFIGAYTAELKRSRAFVFLELCEMGSLESYLRKQKPVFKDGSLESMNMCGCAEEWKQLDEVLSQDMYRWSGEIASGMEFIASKHIVHLDIATRNVLLASDKCAKITDFGLSRRLYDYQTYVKKEQEPLPWRWMAPESLRRSEFTEKSDVWGFGVLLWEIYSLGDEPYHGLSFDFKFAGMLERGLRLDDPTYSQNEIYSVMLRCWAGNPEIRPTFSELTLRLCQTATTPHVSVSTEQMSIADQDESHETLQTSTIGNANAVSNHLTTRIKKSGGTDTQTSLTGSNSKILWSLVSALLVLTLMALLIMGVINFHGNNKGDLDTLKSIPQKQPTADPTVTGTDKIGNKSTNNESSSIDNSNMRWIGRHPKDKALGQKLFNLIDQNDLKSVAVLLQFDADVEQRNEGMETPIIRAAKGNDITVGLKFIKLLIDHGANVHAKDNINQTFLHVLVSDGTTLTSSQFHDIVEYLITKNQSISNLFAMPGWLNDQILFHIAIRNLIVEKRTLSLLHKNKVDFNVLRPGTRNNVIQYAIVRPTNRSLELLSDLISEFGVDWRHLNNYGHSALHLAAEYGSVDEMKFLLMLGLDPNAQENYGNTPLHQALLRGKKNIPEIVQLLVANEAKVSIRNYNGNLPLKAAKLLNRLTDRNKVIKLLYDGAFTQQGPHALGRQLFDVILAMDEEGVKDLVESGADIDIRNDRMETPLFKATNCGNADRPVCLRMIKYLIERGADAYARDLRNLTFLHNFVAKRTIMPTPSQFHAISSFLISKNLSELFNTPGFSYGVTPLHWAVANIDEVENQTLLLLQENGVNFNVLDNDGDSILTWSFIRGKSLKLVSALVSLGTNWKQRNKLNRGLLHVAAQHGHAEGLKYFLRLGLDVNAINAFGNTPLHRVVLFGKNNTLEIIRILIANGANVLITNNNERTAFEEAVKRKDLPNKQGILQLLKESENDAIQSTSNQMVFTLTKLTSNMTDMDNQDHNSTVKLFTAIELHDKASIKRLVENGADVTRKNLRSSSALHLTAISRNKTFAIETIKFLIEQGANVSSRDGEDYTFLHRLVDDGSSLTPTQFHDIAEFLVSKSLAFIFDIPVKFNKSFVIPASPRWKYSSANNTALQLAIKNIEIRPETLSMLQRAGVDFNAVNGNGDSILHFALMGNRSVEFISELISLGADAKHHDSRGRSLLHTATAVGDTNHIKYILDLGLDINGVDVEGLTPLHWALKFPNKNTLENVHFLIENGANGKAIDKVGRAPIYFAVSHDDFKDKEEVIQLLRDNQ